MQCSKLFVTPYVEPSRLFFFFLSILGFPIPQFYAVLAIFFLGIIWIYMCNLMLILLFSLWNSLNFVVVCYWNILNFEFVGVFSGLGDGIEDFPLFARIYYAIPGCGEFDLSGDLIFSCILNLSVWMMELTYWVDSSMLFV